MTDTDELVPNADLLRETMQYVLDHPEHHDQGTWFYARVKDYESRTLCKTTGCFAGNAVTLGGAEIVINWDNLGPRIAKGQQIGWSYIEMPDGVKRFSIQAVAKEMLGLDDDSAGILFGGSNSIERLQYYVDILCSGRQLVADDITGYLLARL